MCQLAAKYGLAVGAGGDSGVAIKVQLRKCFDPDYANFLQHDRYEGPEPGLDARARRQFHVHGGSGQHNFCHLRNHRK